MKNVKSVAAKIKTNPFKHKAWGTLSKYKKIALIGSLILVLAIAGLIIFKTVSDDTNKEVAVDCGQINKDAEQLFGQNKPHEVYDKLMPYEAACNKTLTEDEIRKVDTSAQTIGVMIYKSNMAKSLYLRDDKKQAKVYAQGALDINKNLNELQRPQVAENLSLISEMNEILKNDYYYYPPNPVKPS